MAPRLRNDLVAAFTEEEGVACVEVTDPRSTTSFRFYDFEYALAQQLNGQPLDGVVAWAAETYGIELGGDALDAFVEKLAGLGFLVPESAGAEPAAVAPASGSTELPAFADAPSTVASGLPPTLAGLAEVPGAEAFAAEIAASVVDDEASAVPVPAGNRDATTTGPVGAVAPADVISGDATEYRLKEASSGLWEQAKLGGGPSAAADTPVMGTEVIERMAAEEAATSVPPAVASAPATTAEVPTAVRAAVPLAPQGVSPPAPSFGGGDALEGDGAVSAIAAEVDSALALLGEPPAAPPTETPLAFITQAVAAGTGGAAPLGALDAGATSGADSGPRPPASSSDASPAAPRLPQLPAAALVLDRPRVAVAPSSSSTAAPEAPRPRPSESGDSWAATVAEQIDHPRTEGRAPGRPELVVMPPTAPAASSSTDRAPARPPRRRAPLFLLLLLLGVAAAAAVWFLRTADQPSAPAPIASAPTVHVVSPQPTTFYRWFETVGTVAAGRDDTLAFTRAGKIQDVMAPGTTFAAGEAIARLKGVAERELLANRIRARVAFLEQLRDSSRAQGEAALRQAELKLSEKRRELAVAQTAQAELEIRAKVAGEIAQVLVARGAFVPAGTPVFHVRAAGPQATFALSAEDVTRARALGFCRVETIPGSGTPSPDGGAAEAAAAAGARAIDCAYAAPATAEARLVVDLGNASGVAPGSQVRLASARYDGVYPVPRSAVVRDGDATRLWVATAARTASARPIEVAATIDELALVSRGLSVGDAVIVDPPSSLNDGAALNVER